MKRGDLKAKTPCPRSNLKLLNVHGGDVIRAEMRLFNELNKEVEQGLGPQETGPSLDDGADPLWDTSHSGDS